MEKTIRYAQIPELKKGVAFSDPRYDDSVWCQYRNKFRAKDWYLKLETGLDEDGYVDINLFLGRRSLMAQLSVERDENGDERVSFPSYCIGKEVELGIDTAKIFVGNLENFEAWAEEGSIRTGADGMFGGLIEFTCKHEDKPAGFVLLSMLDGGITDEEELFHTLLSSFDAKEISQEVYNNRINSLGVKAMIAQEFKAVKEATGKEGSTPQQEPPDHDR